MTTKPEKRQVIRVLNAIGAEWTSPKRAIKYVAEGRARYVDDTTIEMIPADRRHRAALDAMLKRHAATAPHAVRPRQSAQLEPTYRYMGPENMRTFAPYPDPGAFAA